MAAGIGVDGPGGVVKHAPAFRCAKEGNDLSEVIQHAEVNLRIIGRIAPNLCKHRIDDFGIAKGLIIQPKLAAHMHNALRKPLIPNHGEDLGEAVNDVNYRKWVINAGAQSAGSNFCKVPRGKPRVVGRGVFAVLCKHDMALNVFRQTWHAVGNDLAFQH